jgi:hypothetical protein
MGSAGDRAWCLLSHLRVGALPLPRAGLASVERARFFVAGRLPQCRGLPYDDMFI